MKAPESTTSHPPAQHLPAKRVALLAIIFDSLIIISFVVQYLQHPTWQMRLMIANVGSLLPVYLIGWFWIHRWKESVRPIFLLVIATELSFIGASFTLDGLEVFYASIVVLLIFLATRPPVLPPEQANWAAVSALIAGALALLPLAFPLSYRLEAPALLRISSYSILGLAALVFGYYFLFRYAAVSLRIKILLASVFFSLLSVAVVATVATALTRQALRRNSEAALSSAAQQVANRLDDYILSNIEIVRTQAQLPLLSYYLLSAQAAPEQRRVTFVEAGQTLLSFRSRNVQNILSYGLLNQRGIVIVDTVSANLGMDESDQIFFQRAMAGISSVSGIYYLGKPPRPVLVFAAPVKDASGNPIGVLRFWLEANALQQVISANSGLAGESSFAALLDEYGIFLAHGEFPEHFNGRFFIPPDEQTLTMLRQNRRLTSTTPIEIAPVQGLAEGLAQLSRSPIFNLEFHREEVSLEQATVARMHTLPWSVLYYQPTTFFIQPLQRQVNLILFSTLGLAVLVAILGAVISETIVRPILQLREVAQRAQQGDLTVAAPVGTRDEVGILGEAFNEMLHRTRDLLSNLEARVQERTAALAERSAYLQAVAEVGRLVFILRDPNILMTRVVEIVRSRFGLYYVGLFEVDGSGEWAVLRAGSGEAGKAMLARGHRIRLGSGMVGWSIANNQARIAQQAELDAVRLRIPELPETRSEAALPLRGRSGVFGALTIQSDRPNAFNPDNLAIFQVLADLVASALENARLYAEMESAVHSLEHVFAERVQRTLEEYFHTHGHVTYRSDGTRVWEDPSAWHAEMEEAFRRQEAVVGAQTLYQQEPVYPLAIPLRVRENVVGVLRTYKPAAKGPWTAQEIRTIQNILDQIGLTLEAAQLYEQSQQRALYEHVLSEITGKIWSAGGIEGILQTALRELGYALNAGEAEIALEMEDGHEG